MYVKHNFPTYYILQYRELSLVRDLDEDTRIFSSFLSSSAPLGMTAVFLGIPSFISDPGNLSGRSSS